MTEFIVLTLLFFDNNMNNIFDGGDKIIEINNNSKIEQNVYCNYEGNNIPELCGYSSSNNEIVGLDEKTFEFIQGKHYTYNSEIFEKGFISGRFLYAEYIDGNYIFKTSENDLNKNNLIYSLSNDDSIYINELYEKLFYGLLILLLGMVGWLILLPKKK